MIHFPAVGRVDRFAVDDDGLQQQVPVLAADHRVVVINDLEIMRLPGGECGPERITLGSRANRRFTDLRPINKQVEVRTHAAGQCGECVDDDRAGT